MRDQAIRYLIVPGWQGSAEDHWQSHWQRVLPGSERLEQHDWLTPRRADWVAALDACIARDPRPTLLIAHSLGCITVAHWAASAPTEHLARLRGALLVAPADVQRARCPAPLQNFAPIARQRLPFPSLLVGSDNDPAASAERARELASDWGSQAVILPAAGHINVQSGHQRWEQGFAYLYRLQTLIEQQARRRA